MANRVLSDFTASVTELKRNPMGTAASGDGATVAILNRNAPAFYCVPAEAYERMMDKIENLELLALAKERQSEASISVSVNEL